MHTTFSGLAAIGITLSLGLVTGCQKRQEPYSVRQEVRDGVEHWIYQAPNGVTVMTTKDHVSVVLAIDRGLSFHVDPTNGLPSGLLLETLGSDGSAGQWVRDVDFDGIPDSRRLKGGGRELFYRGRWYPYKPLGNSVAIDLDGVVAGLRFDGSAWIRDDHGAQGGAKPE